MCQNKVENENKLGFRFKIEYIKRIQRSKLDQLDKFC